MSHHRTEQRRLLAHVEDSQRLVEQEGSSEWGRWGVMQRVRESVSWEAGAVAAPRSVRTRMVKCGGTVMDGGVEGETGVSGVGDR